MNADPTFKQKVDLKWKQLGGNPRQLHKDIARGVKVWNKHHKNKQIAGDEAHASDEMYGLNKYGWAYDNVYLDDVGFCVDCSGNHGVNNLGYIGVAPAIGAGAIIAAASSILAAFAPLLKKAGVDTTKAAEEGAQAERDMYEEEAADYDQEEAYYNEYEQQEAGNSQDEFYPEVDDYDSYEYDDIADYEEGYGVSGMTAEDLQTITSAAGGLVNTLKGDGTRKRVKNAGMKRRAAKRIAKGRPLTKRMKRKGIKAPRKAIPLRGKILPTGVRVIEHGTPVWDKAVRASHGEPGGRKGLHIEQAPRGGQGASDFFNEAKEWVTQNPVPSALIGLVGLKMLSGKKKWF